MVENLRAHRPRHGRFWAVLWATLLMLGLPACGMLGTTGEDSARAEFEGDRVATPEGDVTIRPIEHASFVMGWQGKTVYVDPVGEAAQYDGLPSPDLVLITHLHPDHLDADTLRAIGAGDAPIVAPPSVRDQLPPALAEQVTVMRNGESARVAGIAIEAIPAYNTTPERLQYHPKGRDNGYVLGLDDTRVYIAGDTEDIPAMRALDDIDVAFVPMNLPYTMTVEQAASAVREFAPRIVYPYHSRGSDTDAFKRLVGADSGIEVRLGDWY